MSANGIFQIIGSDGIAIGDLTAPTEEDAKILENILVGDEEAAAPKTPRPDLPAIQMPASNPPANPWVNLKPVDAATKPATRADKLKSVLPPKEGEYDEPVNGFVADEKVRDAMKAAERGGPITGAEARDVLHYLYRMGGDPVVEQKLLERLVGMIEHLESQVRSVHEGASRAVVVPTNNKPLKMDTLRVHPFVVLSQAYLRTWNVAYDFEKFLSQKHKMYFSVNEQMRAYMKSIMRECTMPEHRREFLWDELNHYFQNMPDESSTAKIAVKGTTVPPVPAPMSAREFVNGISFGNARISANSGPDYCEDEEVNIEIEQRPSRRF